LQAQCLCGRRIRFGLQTQGESDSVRFAAPPSGSTRKHGIDIFPAKALRISPFRDGDTGMLKSMADIVEHLRASGHGYDPGSDSLHYAQMTMKSKESRPFGGKLRLERLRLGLTQAALAGLGGVSKATQVAYEADATRPDIGYLSRIAEAGVDILWLATDRRAASHVDWELVDEILELIEEWASERDKPTTRAERKDLLAALYAQFNHHGSVDPAAAAAIFRLAK
jgi:transcriptional regulator with XRE-family HTH domain